MHCCCDEWVGARGLTRNWDLLSALFAGNVDRLPMSDADVAVPSFFLMAAMMHVSARLHENLRQTGGRETDLLA